MIVIEPDSSMQPAEDTVMESPSKRKRNVDPADSSESGMGQPPAADEPGMSNSSSAFPPGTIGQGETRVSITR